MSFEWHERGLLMPRPGPRGLGRRACRQGGTAPPIPPPGDPGGLRVTPSPAPIQATPTRIRDLRDRCASGSDPPPVFLPTPANLFKQPGCKPTDTGAETDSRAQEDRARKIALGRRKLEKWRKKTSAAVNHDNNHALLGQETCKPTKVSSVSSVLPGARCRTAVPLNGIVTPDMPSPQDSRTDAALTVSSQKERLTPQSGAEYALTSTPRTEATGGPTALYYALGIPWCNLSLDAKPNCAEAPPGFERSESTSPFSPPLFPPSTDPFIGQLLSGGRRADLDFSYCGAAFSSHPTCSWLYVTASSSAT